MRIAIISDIHLEEDSFEEGAKKLESTVENVKDAEVDLLVVLGDTAGGEVTGQEEDDFDDVEGLYKRARDILEEASCPIIYLLGNHDVDSLEREELKDILDQELYGFKEFGEEKIIFLDSSAPWLSGARGEITEEQMELLEEELGSEKDTYIFIHHPLHYRDVRDTYWWDKYPERAFCGNKKEVNKNILDKYEVNAIFNGHIHDYSHTRYEGVDHFTIPPFVEPKREEGYNGDYAIVDTDGGLEVGLFREGESYQTYTV